MWLRVLVGSFVVVFCLMYWHAGAQMRASIASDQTRDDWQKLRQQIRSHQQHIAHSVPVRRQDAYRNLDRAGIPQLTKAYAETEAMPVQEEVVEAAVQALFARLNVESSRTPKAPRKRLITAGKRAQPKRLLRVAIYEDGQAVGMRTFEVGGSMRGGRTHRRSFLACPGGKCSLTAAMLAPAGSVKQVDRPCDGLFFHKMPPLFSARR